MKIKTNYSGEYLSVDKEYEVRRIELLNESGVCCEIIDDDGDFIFVNIGIPSAHLQYKGIFSPASKFDDMVNQTLIWFTQESEENREEFLRTPSDELVKYHNSLGRDIRNEFLLWQGDLEEHPDVVSMRVIEHVWELLRVSGGNSCVC